MGDARKGGGEKQTKTAGRMLSGSGRLIANADSNPEPPAPVSDPTSHKRQVFVINPHQVITVDSSIRILPVWDPEVTYHVTDLLEHPRQA